MESIKHKTDWLRRGRRPINIDIKERSLLASKVEWKVSVWEKKFASQMLAWWKSFESEQSEFNIIGIYNLEPNEKSKNYLAVMEWKLESGCVMRG
ncbi:unnamed protein product [Blepharisma stoltei]|uniref:Uncharacterized protein n=1 Tax=Blepharisma stoltei TaxID=1481888 RepID=A0AAU9I6R4_9CILI|nr:unnamed protein product [Blepharisma stoltei]